MSGSRRKPLSLSRRSFLKLGAAAALAGTGTGGAREARALGFVPAEGQASRMVKGYCPFCQVRCTYHARLVRDGETERIAELVGDADNRWTGGAMCPKGMSIVELVGSPHRLTEPMLRTASGWKAIGYAEAVDMVAERILSLRELHGDAISSRLALTSPLWDCRENELAALMAMRVSGGVNVMPAGEVCISSASNVLDMMLGANTSTTTVDETSNCAVLVLMGANLCDLYPPYSRWLERARDSGTFIVYVDFRETRTSRWASMQITPRPGTDGTIVLGAIKYILENQLYDQEYFRSELIGQEEIAEAAREYTPEAVESLSGVSRDELLTFYRILGNSPSTIVWMGGALSRYTNGIATIRSIISLQGITNNLVGRGKGVLTMEGGKPAGEREFVDAVCGPASGQGVNFRRLLAAMQRGTLDLLFLNSSYRRYPDTKTVRAALENVPFIVHRGHFMTEEMEVAHLFLPATFSPESQGSMYGAEKQVVWRDRMLSPPGSCVPDWQFYRDVGRRVAPDTYPDFQSPAELYELFRKTVPSWTGMTLERLQASPDGVVWPVEEEGGEEHVGSQFRDGRLFTEDGRLSFSSAVFGPLRWDFPRGSPQGKDASPDYPLVLTQGKVLTHWQQTLTNFSGALAQFSNGRYINVHPETAARFGLRHGDTVVLETETGAVEGRLETDARILPDCVFTPSHLTSSSPWPQNRSEHINNVIPNYWDRISAQFNGVGCRLVKKDGAA
jgi:formate dehydrogenase major subunit